jgi:hypothetical protein
MSQRVEEVRKVESHGASDGTSAAQSRSESPPSQTLRDSSGESTAVHSFIAAGEETLKRLGRQAREEMKKPTTGAAVAGAVVAGSAVLLGVAETVIGAAAAYVVYRLLKRRGGTGAAQSG